MKDKMHKIIKCVQLPPAVARNSSKLILLSPPCIIKVHYCAAKALFSCPAIISQRLEPRITSNEPLENTEEESKII